MTFNKFKLLKAGSDARFIDSLVYVSILRKDTEEDCETLGLKKKRGSRRTFDYLQDCQSKEEFQWIAN